MKVIRNIWCVARNFREHAKELNNPVPTEPIFFLKAGSCASFPREPIRLPSFSQHIDYELEIALQFDEDLQIRRGCLALDLTARDLQQKSKEKGHPWTLAKSFPGACPLGPFFPLPSLDAPLAFELHVNGAVKQKGDVFSMIFSFKDLVSFCLSRFPVCPGDLLLTGTPSGVTQARPGDEVRALIPHLSEALWNVIKS